MKRCPQCHKQYGEQVRFCVLDGRVLEAAPPLAEPAPRSRFEGRSTDSLIGQVIAGRYRLLAKLGNSTMGTVFKSESAALGRTVAINIFPSELSADAAFVAGFQSEAQAASRFTHANVAAIYDFGITPDGFAYLVSELVEGEPLSDLLRREGALSLHRAVKIAAQVADALEAAHRAGLLHRSLKPGRIRLVPHPRMTDFIKVVGFGLFKLTLSPIGSEEATGYSTRSPEYLAPEQLRGGVADARSDVYALALTAYEMLSGAFPFPGRSASVRAVRQIMSAPVPLEQAAPQISRRVARVVMRGLAREPRDRYATVSEFARDLEAAARDEAMRQMDGRENTTGRTGDGGLAGRITGFLRRSGVSPAPSPGAPARGRRLSIGILFGLAFFMGGLAAALAWSEYLLPALGMLGVALGLWVVAVVRLLRPPAAAGPAALGAAPAGVMSDLPSTHIPSDLPPTERPEPRPLSEARPQPWPAPEPVPLPRPRPEPAPTPDARGGTNCPACGSRLPRGARFCVRDGTPVRADAPPPLMKWCPRCRTRYEAAKQFCPTDGTLLLTDGTG